MSNRFVHAAELLGDVVGQRIVAPDGQHARPGHGGADDSVAPEVKRRREVADIGQRELPMRPGPFLVAADGGDEAIGIEVPNAGLAGICGDRVFEFGPVGVCVGAEACRLLEREPVGRAPVLRAAGRLPHTVRFSMAPRRRMAVP